MSPVAFIILVLATWRVTHLLAKEDGPFQLIYRLRRQLGHGFFGSLLDCFYCLSIWIALPLALWQAEGWKEKLIVWLALSGGACLLEQATTKKGPPTHFFEDKK